MERSKLFDPGTKAIAAGFQGDVPLEAACQRLADIISLPAKLVGDVVVASASDMGR